MSPTPDSMAVRAIPIHDGPIAEAYSQARELSEPRFVPASWYADDRGASLMNLMQGVLCPEGQINYSVQYPGVVKAWHRHRKQTDFWLCLHGHLKVGVLRADDRAAWMTVVGEKRPGVVVIPPPLWHGAATVGPAPAGLLYFVTRAYDPNQPDEERAAPDALGDFPWQVQNR